jgi:serine protease
VAVHGVSGGDQLYSFQAAAGSKLTIMTYAGSGNVSLYVKHAAEPSSTVHDHASTRAGNSETITINAPIAGTYYIKLSGTYSGVSVTARQ